MWVRLLLRCSWGDPHALAQLEQQLAGPHAAAAHRGVTLDQQQQLSVHHKRLGAQRQYIVQQGQKIEDLLGQLEGLRTTTARQTEDITRLDAQRATHNQTLQVAQHGATQQAARIKQLQQQLTAQQQAAEQQRQLAAQHDARITALQGQVDALVQAATHSTSC